MTVEDFPEDLQRFIAEHINSVAQLEILLFLKGTSAGESAVSGICSALAVPEPLASEQLRNLEQSGLVQKTPEQPGEERYRYSPGSPELAAIVDRLADAYAQRRVSVITCIYSKPVDKVRTFADAFRLRKEE